MCAPAPQCMVSVVSQRVDWEVMQRLPWLTCVSIAVRCVQKTPSARRVQSDAGAGPEVRPACSRGTRPPDETARRCRGARCGSSSSQRPGSFPACVSRSRAQRRRLQNGVRCRIRKQTVLLEMPAGLFPVMLFFSMVRNLRTVHLV